MQFEVTRATEADISFVMATERLDGYGAVVGRWEELRHRQALVDGTHAHFIGREDGEPIGFAILRDWASPERVTLIRRLAVTRPGQGQGRRLLASVVGKVFEETDAYRVWIGHFPENLRAHRAYEGVGFVQEGIARGSAYFGGAHRDEVIMSLLRPEWEALSRARQAG
ncbi:GNAT family N-acetyltransferase [Mesorhizobium sp. ASY16-5R]|uniref:GNAT family N-acetyltransferase n=1 Tax=Mesorhizobium sp. ASY16-5R TaxID=3445772 RepID=UPI003FA00E21